MNGEKIEMKERAKHLGNILKSLGDIKTRHFYTKRK